MGTGTPLVLTFWIPLKEYDPLILGSISLIDVLLIVGCGAIIFTTPPTIMETPTAVNALAKVPAINGIVEAAASAPPPTKASPIIIFEYLPVQTLINHLL